MLCVRTIASKQLKRALRLLGILFAFLCASASQPVLAQSTAPELPDSGATEATLEQPKRLGVMILDVDGPLDRETRKQMARALEDALCLYPNFAVYTRAAFLNQVGWERQAGTLECQFPDDCAADLRERLGIRHEVSLTFAERADGRLNVRLRLIVGEEGRDFVETAPDLDTARAMIAAMMPDLIGLPPEVGADQGVIHVSSFPLGARVRVEGREVGVTPLSLALPGGMDIRVSAEREGHPPLNHTLKTRKGELVRWHADLMTRQGGLLVDSNPVGATVLLDDRPVGVTPLILHGILAGDHHVTLRMPPYPDAIYDVTLVPEDMTRVRHGFSSDHGTLIVRPANPELLKKRVEIYLNDAKVSESTYTAHLPPGRYIVAIVAGGYQTSREEVELLSGKTVTVSPTLTRGFSLRPGEEVKHLPDYRPGGFSTAFGALLLGFGIYLELEAQSHDDSANASSTDDADRASHRKVARDSRIAGGVLMGVGSAALITGVVLLILPPERLVAVVPQIEADGGGLSMVLEF